MNQSENQAAAKPSELSALLALPKVEDALLYSRNFAAASPYLTNTAKHHITGLCDLLEAQTNALMRLLELCHQNVADDEAKHDGAVSDGGVTNLWMIASLRAILRANARLQPTTERSEGGRLEGVVGPERRGL